MAINNKNAKGNLTTAQASLYGKAFSSVLDNGTDFLKTFYEKSGESKKVAAIKEWEALRDNGTISEEDFQLKLSSLLGRNLKKEKEPKSKKQEELEIALKIETLRKYKGLLELGTLTTEQFSHQKQEILAEKLPKALSSHEAKIKAVQLYEELRNELVLTDREFEAVKDKILGISHQLANKNNLLNKVKQVFPKNKKGK